MASPLKDRIQKSMTEAMKLKQPERLTTLRLIFNAIRKKEIDERKDLVDAEVEKVLMTLSKQVGEALEQAKSAGRLEAIREAESELQVIKEFLPEALSSEALEQQVQQIVDELKVSGALPSGPAAMGAVMKVVMPRLGGRADGRSIQEAVKRVLS